MHGVLTEAEADKIVEDIDSKREALLPGFDGEAGVRFHFGPAAMALPAVGHAGFFGALQQAVDEGILTQAEMEQIVRDFAEIAGESVSLDLPDREALEDGEAHSFSFSIEGTIEELRTAMAAALESAVADGVLTAEEADEILANTEESELRPPVLRRVYNGQADAHEIRYGDLIVNFTRLPSLHPWRKRLADAQGVQSAGNADQSAQPAVFPVRTGGTSIWL